MTKPHSLCRLASSFFLALISASPVALWAGDDSDQFLRIHHDAGGQPKYLQVAIKSYVPRSANSARLRIDLIGAVHIGEADYYAALNDQFRKYDAVLYELIAPEGSRVRRSKEQRAGVISSTQLAITSALNLSFQLDDIDYSAGNFVHADLSPDEIAASMRERGESLYTYFWKLFYVSMEEVAKDPLGLRNIEFLTALLEADQENALRTAFAMQLVEAKSITAVFEGDEGSTIIAARNIRALDVLRRQIDAGQRHIGIFYGAAHMADMEKRLLAEFEVEKQQTIWVNAWRLTAENNEP